MFKIKKIISCILIVIVLVTMIVGCSKDTTTSANNTSGAKTVNYPSSSIQIVIPYNPGGDTDLNARTLAKYLTMELRKNVVVTNMPGASGSIAYDYVKDADPDGHTVLFAHNAMLISNVAGLVESKHTDYEVAGIGVQASTQVWATSSKSEYNTVEKIVSKLKAEPESLTFATLFGNFTHLESLAFQREAGVKLKLIDAGAGASDHLSALLGGHVDVISAPYNVVKDYVETGELVILGNVTGERDPLISNVPTFKEQGVDLDFSKVYPFFFPKGTPSEIVDIFTNALKKVSEKQEYVADMNAMYMVTNYYSPEESKDILAEIYEFFNTFEEIKPK